MSDDNIDSFYIAYLVIWLTVPVILFQLKSRRGEVAGILVYAYILSFLVSYWFGALVHASPWNQFGDNHDTIVGFRYSTYGLLAFVCGVLIVNPSHKTFVNSRLNAAPAVRRHAELAKLEHFALRYFMPFGAACWFAESTPIASLPSASSILSAGKAFVVLSICLGCWSTWFRGQRRSFLLWFSIAFLLPLLTVITAGFLGYGIVMATTVVAFVAMFFRPRWLLLAGFCAMLFAGISLWAAYAVERTAIREAVWGEQNYSARVDSISKMLSNLKPFDMSDPAHLAAVDSRLNQNVLVGAAVRNTPSIVPFEDGATLIAGALAMIPRALWQDKPTFAGSGNYVAVHTQTEFAQGTSVGMGQVLEFYINFGLSGVLIGLFAYGACLRYLDIKLVDALNHGDWNGVVLSFVVGSAMLQAGGAFAEVTASAAAAAVLCFVSSRTLVWDVTSIRRIHAAQSVSR